MIDDERGAFACRVLRTADAEEAGSQSANDVEGQFGRRRIVQDVPCTENQFVLTGFQFRYIIIGGTCGIAAEVEFEVLVEHIGAFHASVDDQLQIVADAVARRVDAVLVGHLSHEVGSRIDVAAVGERWRVEIAVNGGSDGVVDQCGGATDEEAVAFAVGAHRVVVVDCISRDKAGLIGVVDVLRNGTGECEAPVSYTVGTGEKRLRAVLIDEWLLGLGLVVHLADDGLQIVAYGYGNDAVETWRVLNMSCYACHRTGLQRGQLLRVSLGCDAVDGIDDDVVSRSFQCQCGVAQQLELQQVDAAVQLLRDDFVLGQTDCIAQCVGLVAVEGQYMVDETGVDVPVLCREDGACCSKEGYGATF